MLTTNDISTLTGWTRAQLNQANSRIGFGGVLEESANGAARRYGRGAAIMYAVAGKLRSVGMSWEDLGRVLIRDGLMFRNFVAERTNLDEFHSAANAQSGPALLVVHRASTGPDGITVKIDGEAQRHLRACLCFADHYGDWLADPRTDETTSIVVGVKAVVEMVDQHLLWKNSH